MSLRVRGRSARRAHLRGLEFARDELFRRQSRLRQTQAEPRKIPRFLLRVLRLRGSGVRPEVPHRRRHGFRFPFLNEETLLRVPPGRGGQPFRRLSLSGRQLPGLLGISGRPRPRRHHRPSRWGVRRRREGRDFRMMRVGHRERLLRNGSRTRRYGYGNEAGSFLNRAGHRYEIRNRFVLLFLSERFGRFRFLRFLMGRRTFAFLRAGHLRRNDRRCQRALDRHFPVRFRQLEPLRDVRPVHLGLQWRVRLGFGHLFL